MATTTTTLGKPSSNVFAQTSSPQSKPASTPAQTFIGSPPTGGLGQSGTYITPVGPISYYNPPVRSIPSGGTPVNRTGGGSSGGGGGSGVIPTYTQNIGKMIPIYDYNPPTSKDSPQELSRLAQEQVRTLAQQNIDQQRESVRSDRPTLIMNPQEYNIFKNVPGRSIQPTKFTAGEQGIINLGSSKILGALSGYTSLSEGIATSGLYPSLALQVYSERKMSGLIQEFKTNPELFPTQARTLSTGEIEYTLDKSFLEQKQNEFSIAAKQEYSSKTSLGLKSLGALTEMGVSTVKFMEDTGTTFANFQKNFALQAIGGGSLTKEGKQTIGPVIEKTDRQYSTFYKEMPTLTFTSKASQIGLIGASIAFGGISGIKNVKNLVSLGLTKQEAISSVTIGSIEALTPIRYGTTGLVGSSTIMGKTSQLAKSEINALSLGKVETEFGMKSFSTIKGGTSYISPGKYTYTIGVPSIKEGGIVYKTSSIDISKWQNVKLPFGENIFETSKFGEKGFITTGKGLRELRTIGFEPIQTSQYTMGKQLTASIESQAFTGGGLSTQGIKGFTTTGTNGDLIKFSKMKIGEDALGFKSVRTGGTSDLLLSPSGGIGFGRGDFTFKTLSRSKAVFGKEGLSMDVFTPKGRMSMGRGVSSTALKKIEYLESGGIKTTFESKASLFSGKNKVSTEFLIKEYKGIKPNINIDLSAGGKTGSTKDIVRNRLQLMSMEEPKLQSRSKMDYGSVSQAFAPKGLNKINLKTNQINVGIGKQSLGLSSLGIKGSQSEKSLSGSFGIKALTQSSLSLGTKSNVNTFVDVIPGVVTITDVIPVPKTTTYTTVESVFTTPILPGGYDYTFTNKFVPMIPALGLPSFGGFSLPTTKTRGRKSREFRIAPSFSAIVENIKMKSPLKVSKTFGVNPFQTRGLLVGKKAKGAYYQLTDL